MATEAQAQDQSSVVSRVTALDKKGEEDTERSDAREDRERLMSLAVAAADGFRGLAAAADGGSISDIGGASCWYSSSHVPAFNGAGLFSPRLINEHTISAIRDFFSARGPTYSLVTIDALVPDAMLLLPRFGFYQYDSNPAMWLEELPRDSYGGNIALRVTRVRSYEELLHYRSVLKQVFALPQTEVELVLSEEALRVPYVRHYLGCLGSTPVATATLVLTGTVAGVWNVGTLSSHRRQGIGERIVREALLDARVSGYRSSMLLSSQEGLPLYTRLGYRTLSTVRVFVPGD